MPLIETGMAETLNDINIWPIAITIIGSHGSPALSCWHR
jgi:hypothetical protein